MRFFTFCPSPLSLPPFLPLVNVHHNFSIHILCSSIIITFHSLLIHHKNDQKKNPSQKGQIRENKIISGIFIIFNQFLDIFWKIIISNHRSYLYEIFNMIDTDEEIAYYEVK